LKVNSHTVGVSVQAVPDELQDGPHRVTLMRERLDVILRRFEQDPSHRRSMPGVTDDAGGTGVTARPWTHAPNGTGGTAGSRQTGSAETRSPMSVSGIRPQQGCDHRLAPVHTS
jgi:hypothetical protein